MKRIIERIKKDWRVDRFVVVHRALAILMALIMVVSVMPYSAVKAGPNTKIAFKYITARDGAELIGDTKKAQNALNNWSGIPGDGYTNQNNYVGSIAFYLAQGSGWTGGRTGGGWTYCATKSDVVTARNAAVTHCINTTGWGSSAVGLWTVCYFIKGKFSFRRTHE